LPSELEANYGKTMERIAEQSPETKDLAFRVLLWVSHALEPLSVNALRHALAVELGMKSLHEDDLDDVEALISACAGLVVVDEGDKTYQELLSQHGSRSYEFADMGSGADGIVRLVRKLAPFYSRTLTALKYWDQSSFNKLLSNTIQ
jgi:hypothetical protein